jgi:hypothetical protein
MSSGGQQNPLLKEEDIEELVKRILANKNYNMEKVSKRVMVELAQTFID